MESNIKDLTPFCATHPGSVLKEEITNRGIKSSELADEIGVSRSIVSDILHEKRNITAEIALKLEQFLGLPASYWMQLQANYELDSERIAQRAKKSKTDALSVANYFVSKSLAEKHPITLLTLVKLVYLSQGYSLALLDRPITNAKYDRIEAWKFGPVLPNVYNSFKYFKTEPITHQTSLMKWDSATGDYFFEDPIVEDKDTIIILNKVWETYKDWNSTKLINELHQQDTPWYKNYKEGKNNIIPDKETAEYYKKLLKI